MRFGTSRTRRGVPPRNGFPLAMARSILATIFGFTICPVSNTKLVAPFDLAWATILAMSPCFIPSVNDIRSRPTPFVTAKSSK